MIGSVVGPFSHIFRTDSVLAGCLLAGQIHIWNDQRHYLFPSPERFWFYKSWHGELIQSKLSLGTLKAHAQIHDSLLIDEVVFLGEEHDSEE